MTDEFDDDNALLYKERINYAVIARDLNSEAVFLSLQFFAADGERVKLQGGEVIKDFCP